MDRPRTFAAGFVDGWLSVLHGPVPAIPEKQVSDEQDEYGAGFEQGRAEALGQRGEQAPLPPNPAG
jgi:hypothetical protein